MQVLYIGGLALGALDSRLPTADHRRLREGVALSPGGRMYGFGIALSRRGHWQSKENRRREEDRLRAWQSPTEANASLHGHWPMAAARTWFPPVVTGASATRLG